MVPNILYTGGGAKIITRCSSKNEKKTALEVVRAAPKKKEKQQALAGSLIFSTFIYQVLR